MVDLEMLRNEFGLTQANLKQWLYTDLNIDPGNVKVNAEDESGNFDPAKTDADSAARNVMRNRIRSRIQEGLNRNLTEGRHYYALDQAWDTPFRQVSATLLQSLMDKNMPDEDVEKVVANWGLTSMLSTPKDPKTGKNTPKLNLPVFFNVFVPLCKAYVTIRWAKIVNDRRLTPFLKYEPAKVTSISKMKCEAITDRVQVMSLQYGYFEAMKQAVFQMLHYSFCMQFPKEEWHAEQQWRSATQADVDAGAKVTDDVDAKVGDMIKATVKEGLRFHAPHPSRVIRDLNYPAHTYNTDSGCEYAGYWRIMRYRDLCGGEYWNTDRISIGANDLIGQNQTFFTTVYPCTMAWPNGANGGGVATSPPSASGTTLAVEAGVGVGELDREKKMANQFYTTDFADHAVLVTEYYERLIPSQNGMGDYDCPVWFRFVVAGDQATILYATPLPSCPGIYYGYDEDVNRAMNASMTLEVLPFQDQFGNLLSQMLLTVKQNLANIIFVDEDQVEPTAMERLKNTGEGMFRSLNIQGFSSRKAVRAQSTPKEAVQAFKFPQGNTSELMTAMKTILETLERVLVISAQELGQAASHEQTREEILNITQSQSSRQIFTQTPVDSAREAWKRQIYAYLMAYGDGTFYAHVPSDTHMSEEVLKEHGFTYVDAATHQRGRDVWRKVKTSLKESAVEIWEFAGARDGEDRTNDKETAQIMGTLLKDLLDNPITAPAIGARQAIDIANKIAHLSGLPRDFRLHAMPAPQAPGMPAPTPGQTPQLPGAPGRPSPGTPAITPDQANAHAMLSSIIEQVLPVLNREIGPIAKATTENTQAVAVIMKALGMAPQPPQNADQTQPPGPPQ